jgi:hypothetical protein
MVQQLISENGLKAQDRERFKTAEKLSPEKYQSLELRLIRDLEALEKAVSEPQDY